MGSEGGSDTRQTGLLTVGRNFNFDDEFQSGKKSVEVEEGIRALTNEAGGWKVEWPPKVKD